MEFFKHLSARKKTALVGVFVLVPVALFLAIAVFGLQTLFIDDKVDEAGPVFSSGVIPTTAIDTAQGEASSTTGPAVSSTTEANEQTTTMLVAPTTQQIDEVVAVLAGNFVDRSHPAAGTAEVLNDGSSQRFLRFEDFEVDNGPDLFVYLTTAGEDASASEFGREGEFVNLGVLKGNIGSQNYEIPEDVDLEKFNTVVIWCRRFSVAFAAANLS